MDMLERVERTVLVVVLFHHDAAAAETRSPLDRAGTWNSDSFLTCPVQISSSSYLRCSGHTLATSSAEDIPLYSLLDEPIHDFESDLLRQHQIPQCNRPSRQLEIDLRAQYSII